MKCFLNFVVLFGFEFIWRQICCISGLKKSRIMIMSSAWKIAICSYSYSYLVLRNFFPRTSYSYSYLQFWRPRTSYSYSYIKNFSYFIRTINLGSKLIYIFLKKSAAGAKIFNFIHLFNKNSMNNFKFFKILDENRLIPCTHTRTRTSFFNPSYLVLVLVP